jgi:ribosomal protein L37AE/L43A
VTCQLCGAPARFRTNIKVWLCDACCHAAQVLAVGVVRASSPENVEEPTVTNRQASDGAK